MADKAGATARRASVASSQRLTIARRLRQRADRGARTRRAGNDGSLRQSPRAGGRRQRRARAIGGRLRPMGRQLRARRTAIDEDARSDLPRDVAARPDSPRPASRIACRDHPLVRRRVSRSARASGTRACLFQPGRDDDLAFRFGYDAGATRWPTWRLLYGLSATSSARVPLSKVPGADGERHACRLARMWDNCWRRISN